MAKGVADGQGDMAIGLVFASYTHSAGWLKRLHARRTTDVLVFEPLSGRWMKLKAHKKKKSKKKDTMEMND